MKWKIFFSGEIHSDWRTNIVKLCRQSNLPIEFLNATGVDVPEVQEDDNWIDKNAAKINAIRIQNGLDKADLIILKFGEKFDQWSAAYDAGYARAMNKPYVVIRPPELIHILKEVDSGASAVADCEDQVVDILKGIILKKKGL